MTKDGVHFARIIHTSKGFIIQKGKVALGDEKYEEVEVPAAIHVDDRMRPAPCDRLPKERNRETPSNSI